MSQVDTQTEMTKLDSLLEEEREALLVGDLQKMAQLLEQKEQLIDALNATEHNDLPSLQRLDGKVRRNQLLLNGALEGIRSVSQRMAALQQVRQSLDTYDSAGHKKRIEMENNHTVEKRA